MAELERYRIEPISELEVLTSQPITDPVTKNLFEGIKGVKEFFLPEPKLSDPLSLLDYLATATPPGRAATTAGKALSKIDLDLDADDLEEFVDWVKSSKNEYQKKAMQDLLNRKANKDIKNISKNYLKENDLINKDGTVTLYRYLNIAESNKLQPDKGLSSTTLNPAHAKKMAIKQSEVTGRKLKEGQKADIFDSFDPTSSNKYETTTLYRKPVVLEYKVPVEKVEAYLPAVFNSIDQSGSGFKHLARRNVENRYPNLVDDLVDEGYDYFDALDELKDSYGFDDIYDSIDAANLESEVLIDLTNIKPKKVYSDFSEVNQIVDLNILDRLEFSKGDEVRSEIDEDLEALLSGKRSLANDPLYKLSMMVIGPSGKFKAADIVADFFKHQRIQSLLKSGAPGDITEIKQIQKGLKIKNPTEAEKLYMDLQNKGKELASPEDIQKAIEEFLKK